MIRLKTNRDHQAVCALLVLMSGDTLKATDATDDSHKRARVHNVGQAMNSLSVFHLAALHGRNTVRSPRHDWHGASRTLYQGAFGYARPIYT